jgi:hypothetical protein
MPIKSYNLNFSALAIWALLIEIHPNLNNCHCQRVYLKVDINILINSYVYIHVIFVHVYIDC